MAEFLEFFHLFIIFLILGFLVITFSAPMVIYDILYQYRNKKLWVPQEYEVSLFSIIGLEILLISVFYFFLCF